MSEHKTLQLSVDNLNYEGRTVEGHAATFGNLDQVGDIIHPGAFAKTITERGQAIKFLWQHQPSEPLGKIMALQETPTGLFFRAAISDTARGRDALALLRDGAIGDMSIGYDPVQSDYSTVDGKQVRNLRQVKLYEISLVSFPANPEAQVTALKTASGDPDLSLAARDRSWDASAAEYRVRAWAGGAEDMDWSKYGRAFFYVDPERREQFGGYKLGFADVLDGELTAIPRGLFAVAAVLQGSRGGVDIPDADAAGVRRRVARYYARMRREFDDENLLCPWEKQVHKAVNLATKGGRVLAKRNAERVRAALDALREVLDDAGLLDEEPVTEPAEPETMEAGPGAKATPPTPSLDVHWIEQQIDLLEIDQHIADIESARGL